MLEQTRFGTRKTVRRDFDEVVASTRRALTDQAFRIISEVDLGPELHPATRRKCTVIAAWNSLASRALEREPDVGAILPFNVVVYEEPGGACVVSAADPCNALEVAGPDMLIEEAMLDAQEKLHRAIQNL